MDVQSPLSLPDWALTWLGFGFAPRFPFNLGCGGVVGLGCRLFALLAALAHPPSRAAGHQQGRRRLGAWKGSGRGGIAKIKKKENKIKKRQNTTSGVSVYCRVSTPQLSQELFFESTLCVVPLLKQRAEVEGWLTM